MAPDPDWHRTMQIHRRHMCGDPATHETTWDEFNLDLCARHAVAVDRHCRELDEPMTCVRIRRIRECRSEAR